MKVVFFFMLIIVSHTLIAQQYSITGTIPKTPDGTNIYLYQRVGEVFKTDSGVFKGNKFTLKGSITEPTNVFLLIKRNGKKRLPGDLLETFIGPETITLSTKDSLSKAKFIGSTSNTDFVKMTEMVKPAYQKLEPLNKQYERAYKMEDKAEMKKIEAQMEAIQQKEINPLYVKYIENNPKSFVTLKAFESFTGYDLDYNTANPVWEKIDASIKNSTTGKIWQQKLEKAYLTRVGAVAPDFSQNNTEDKAVTLSSMKGKYVLVDFWASWCGPCRAENPNVVANYTKYKDKNFTVLGISLDDKKDKWLKAIKADKLDWMQVSDLKGWKNEIAIQYGIEGIPQNFLIDPNGVIVARNLREDKLSEKLAELLK